MDRIEREYGFRPPEPCNHFLYRRVNQEHGPRCVQNNYAKLVPVGNALQ